ncbi:MAG: restriction endonuclease, partial [Planctomycetia bacterium]|nr:restriction endonuclease [Planctomycetia bacterium]
AFFGDLVAKEFLASLYQFENEEKLFADVHHSFCFVVVALGKAPAADFLFFARQTSALANKDRHFSLTPADFTLLNPNTRTCPTFRSGVDADLNKLIYRRTGVLWDERNDDDNRWQLRFMRMFDMANDSGLFRTQAQMQDAGQTLAGNCWDGPLGKYVPLIEAKMVHQFDHRYSTYEGATQANLNSGNIPQVDEMEHQRAAFVTTPDYWVAQSHVDSKLAERSD